MRGPVARWAAAALLAVIVRLAALLLRLGRRHRRAAITDTSRGRALVRASNGR